jgi:LysM repeat protein
MQKKITIIILLALFSTSTFADEVQVNPDSPDKYVVQKGDTLWGIAGKFLTQPWRWPEIWKGNPQIENPHLIYPGDVVSLSYQGGSPVLSVAGGDAGDAGSGTAAVSTGGRDVKLSPAVRSYDRGDAVPTIPIDAIRHFLSRPLVLGDGEMSGWPYVVSSFDQHLVAGEGSRIYIRGLSGSAEERRYSIYRQGPAYMSGGEVIGYEAIFVGEAVIEKFGDPATAYVTQTRREVLTGDRLTPQSEKEVHSDFIPRSPAGKVEGSIISVIDGLSEIGQYQVVVLDVGSRQGIEVGSVLGVFQSGKVVSDKTGQKQHHPLIDYLGTGGESGEPVVLPEEYTGVVMVFRTFDRVSYALVMEATGALNLNDAVRSM